MTTPTILVLCTGNIARSPMAAALLDHALRERGMDAEVTSAGLLTVDRPAAADAVDLLSDLGIDLGGHRSCIMDVDRLRAADLIIGMERRHVREAAVLDRAAFDRAFPLVDLADRAGARPRRPGESVREWATRLSTDRDTADLLGDGPPQDVADPYRQGRAAFRRALEEISAHLDVVADALAP